MKSQHIVKQKGFFEGVSKIILFGLTLCILISSIASAASIDPSQIGMGARMIALGRTSVALDNDSGAVFINPALLGMIKNPQIGTMYSNLGDDLSYRFVGLSANSPLGGLGLSYIDSNLAGFPETTYEAGRVVETGRYFDYTNSTIGLSYGKEIFSKLYFGLTAKANSKTFTGKTSGSGVSGDVGLLFMPKDTLLLGLSMQNAFASDFLWQDGTTEKVEALTKVGARLQAKSYLMLAGELDKSESGPATLHCGLEYLPLESLALRAGIDQVPTSTNYLATNFTAGVGLNISGVKFDYAYYYDTVLTDANTTQYFSFGYEWLNKPAQKIMNEATLANGPSVRTGSMESDAVQSKVVQNVVYVGSTITNKFIPNKGINTITNKQTTVVTLKKTVKKKSQKVQKPKKKGLGF